MAQIVCSEFPGKTRDIFFRAPKLPEPDTLRFRIPLFPARNCETTFWRSPGFCRWHWGRLWSSSSTSGWRRTRSWGPADSGRWLWPRTRGWRPQQGRSDLDSITVGCSDLRSIAVWRVWEAPKNWILSSAWLSLGGCPPGATGAWRAERFCRSWSTFFDHIKFDLSSIISTSILVRTHKVSPSLVWTH